MPYKHIAAQLKKTELACRLHYHQLSFGSKSRRNTSISSRNSFDRSSMTPPARMRQSTPQLPLPSFSPPASPEAEYRGNRAAAAAGGPESQSHKPILPKPVSSPLQHQQTQRSGSSSAHPQQKDSRQLRLVTDDVETYNERQYVDMARLDRLYDAHRLHFWSTIARGYGCNLSPSTLEDAWRRAHSVSTSNLPPTPRGSPQSVQAAPSILSTPYSAIVESSSSSSSTNNKGGFTPVNIEPSSRGNSMPPVSIGSGYPRSRESSIAPRSGSTAKSSSFAISSLLTENKEIRRSPTSERKLAEVEMAYA